jgi:hypothetical protein
VRRTGPLRDRAKLAVQRRLMVGAWRLSERLGIDLAGATEGPPYVTDDERRRVFDELIDTALAGDGALDGTSGRYPAHELLTHLVVERGFLLHGSNHVDLEMLEPRPARDHRTELISVAACDDGIWPIFYAVLARRDGLANVFTACTHLGPPHRARRFYMFVVFDADPRASGTWTHGAVYAVRRTGFRRAWGNEWVSPGPVQPLLRVLVGSEDFPLLDAVLAATGDDLGRINRRLRGAKRHRARATEPG